MSTSQFLPSQQQTILLKSCLTRSDSAIEYFERWAKTTEINFDKADTTALGLPQVYDRLDFGSQRLLSLLYYNLSQQGLTNPTIEKLRGYFKFIWLKNQVIQNELNQVSNAFNSRGIDIIAFKGVSMFQHYYPHPGARPAVDLDIVIHPGQIETAEKALSEIGWRPKLHRINISSLGNLLTHAITLKKEKQELDLHHRFSHFFINPTTEDRLWELSKLGAPGVRYLSPSHELFCAILHGVIWSSEPGLRWVPDAVFIIDKFQTNDWLEFLTLTERENYDSFITQALSYLDNENFVTIPHGYLSIIINKNQRIPDSSLLRLTKLLTSKREPNDYNHFKRNYLTAKLLFKSNNDVWKAIFTHYKSFWGVKNNYRLLIYACYKMVDKMFNRKKRFQSSQSPLICKGQK